MDSPWSGSETYPEMVALLERGIQDDIWYEYVSSTFLDGMLPYLANHKVSDRDGKVRAAFLLQRYRGSRNLTPPEATISDEELVATLSKMRAEANTKLSTFDDDVVLVCETPGYWWVLHLDCDTSDCGFGRLAKEDTLLDEVLAWVRQRFGTRGMSIRAELPLDVIKGWVQW